MKNQVLEPWKDKPCGFPSYFRLSATATATATVAPTIGLLPMPRKPIISTCAGTEEEHSNSAGDLLPYGQELFSYAEAVEHYYHKCVLKESVPDFLQFLDAENLMRELRTKDRVSRRDQSVPNAIGNIYFEVRANRVQQTETSFQILLDFRSVDEIVREEREHQHALERALQESRTSYEVISAISKIYYTIYRIDLRTGHYEEVANERQMHRLTGHSGRASVHMSEMSKQSIVAGVSALC